MIQEFYILINHNFKSFIFLEVYFLLKISVLNQNFGRKITENLVK